MSKNVSFLYILLDFVTINFRKFHALFLDGYTLISCRQKYIIWSIKHPFFFIEEQTLLATLSASLSFCLGVPFYLLNAYFNNPPPIPPVLLKRPNLVYSPPPSILWFFSERNDSMSDTIRRRNFIQLMSKGSRKKSFFLNWH